jgi:hypothetical protein
MWEIILKGDKPYNKHHVRIHKINSEFKAKFYHFLLSLVYRKPNYGLSIARIKTND